MLQPAALLADHPPPPPDPSVATDAAPTPAPITSADSVPSDEQLLASFLAGDRDAPGLLAQRYERPLLGLAHALHRGRRDLALESTQDTWLRVIKYGRSFKRGSSFKTWLYRILINTTKDTAHKHARFRLAQHDSGPRTEGPSAPDPDRLAPLHAALDHLSPDQRLLIVLCYHQGLTHPQAADVLNIPTGTIKSRLHTALTKLREHMPEPISE